jgi:hypothetical protein
MAKQYGRRMERNYNQRLKYLSIYQWKIIVNILKHNQATVINMDIRRQLVDNLCEICHSFLKGYVVYL